MSSRGAEEESQACQDQQPRLLLRYIKGIYLLINVNFTLFTIWVSFYRDMCFLNYERHLYKKKREKRGRGKFLETLKKSFTKDLT